MKREVKFLEFFKKQVEYLDQSSRNLIYNRIQLIKENHYRYKRIHSKQFSKVFRVRLNIGNKETRLIYIVIEPNIIVACLLDRKKDYKNLEKYLKKFKE